MRLKDEDIFVIGSLIFKDGIFFDFEKNVEVIEEVILMVIEVFYYVFIKG